MSSYGLDIVSTSVMTHRRGRRPNRPCAQFPMSENSLPTAFPTYGDAQSDRSNASPRPTPAGGRHAAAGLTGVHERISFGYGRDVGLIGGPTSPYPENG